MPSSSGNGYRGQLWRQAMVGIIPIIWATSSNVGADPALGESTPSTPTVRSVDLIRIAAQRPCAATAIFYLGVPTVETQGILDLEGMPTEKWVEVLLDHDGSLDSDHTEAVVPRSPYSSAPYFVEVRWKVSFLHKGSYIFSTEVELVGADGNRISPTHRLEEPSRILVSDKSMSLLSGDEAI